jgi:hypothetical protein
MDMDTQYKLGYVSFVSFSFFGEISLLAILFEQNSAEISAKKSISPFRFGVIFRLGGGGPWFKSFAVRRIMIQQNNANLDLQNYGNARNFENRIGHKHMPGSCSVDHSFFVTVSLLKWNL